MPPKENKRQRAAREALEAHLGEGEQLLAYSRCYGYNDGYKAFYVGLTDQRLLLEAVRKGKAAETLPPAIRREFISGIRRAALGSSVRVDLPGDRLVMRFQSNWRRRGRALIEAFRADPPAEGAAALLPAEVVRQQAHTFQRLGFPSSARELLADPSVSGDAGTAALRDQISEDVMALKVAAVFLFINIALGLFLIALSFLQMPSAGGAGAPFFILAALIDFSIGISLWRGRTQFRTWAIIRAVASFVLYGIPALIGLHILDAILQAAFAGAFVILLVGKSNRTRTTAAVMLYAIGYVSLFLVSVVASAFLGLIGA